MPILVDSRYRLLEYQGMTTCTPNESEVEQILGVHIDDDPDALERAGREVLRRTRSAAVLVTRGSRGMALFQPRQATVHIPIFGSSEVADVTGAGDTVIATFALALAAGGSFEEAARLANCAGGLVVKKRGTATVSGRELIGAACRAADERFRRMRVAPGLGSPCRCRLPQTESRHEDRRLSNPCPMMAANAPTLRGEAVSGCRRIARIAVLQARSARR